MFNLFKYSYKLTPTSKPDTFYLSPTASTWVKAFAPSLVVGAGFAALYVYGVYLERKAQAGIDQIEEDTYYG